MRKRDRIRNRNRIRRKLSFFPDGKQEQVNTLDTPETIKTGKMANEQSNRKKIERKKSITDGKEPSK